MSHHSAFVVLLSFAVGFGSALILAWAADSSKGVEMLISQVTVELERTMAATGCANLSAINKSIIVETTTMKE